MCKMEIRCTGQRMQILLEERSRLEKSILPILPNDNPEILNEYYEFMDSLDKLISKEARLMADMQ